MVRESPVVKTSIQFNHPLLIVYDNEDQVPLPVLASTRITLLDLFSVRGDEVRSCESHIDKFYAKRGSHEIFEKHMRVHGVKSGKLLLVRKVAAIEYAVAIAQQPVVWLDSDVHVQMQAFDGVFWNFVSRFDVAFIPLAPRLNVSRNEPWQTFEANSWRVESGVMALAPNSRARQFTKTVLSLYNGNLLSLADECTRERSCQAWVTDNLYQNDVYTWALAAHAIAKKVSYTQLPVDHSTRLGWFASNTSGESSAGIGSLQPLATGFTSPFLSFGGLLDPQNHNRSVFAGTRWQKKPDVVRRTFRNLCHSTGAPPSGGTRPRKKDVEARRT